MSQVIFEKDKEAYVDLAVWQEQLPVLNRAYQNQEPFPHIVLDNFLLPKAAQQALEAFPEVSDEGWIHYLHVNEKKFGLNKIELLPAFHQKLIDYCNREDFVKWVSQLTGISNLKADPTLEGGGLHQSRRGGFLNIHADFTVHPHKRNWRRRVNLLLYFNKDWKASYKGDLELWERDMSACVQKISPIFNRCVLFNTDEDSFHGLPDPIQCPEEMTRKSIALYYYTEEAEVPKKKATNYRARPTDSWYSGVLIFLDKTILSIYNSLKGWLGIDDEWISNLLRRINGKKR